MSNYELKIDLNVLNHLGLNLYSNIPSVLSELIANAWDAESKNVQITISSEEIKIEDDGCGMNENDLNNKFLNVGYQRRKDSKDDLTPRLKRKVMGRKGIGKLSIFSIAEHIEVFTKKESALGISMEIDEIRKMIERKESYHPEEIASEKAEKTIKHTTGTTIILKKIKKRVASSLSENLKKRVARRFDIWSEDFIVIINNEKISIEDRDYFHKLEFITTYGNYPDDHLNMLKKNKMLIKRPATIDGKEVCGWIGLIKESGELQDGSDNLNKISVLARGKVALEDILEQYREGGLYTKFLVGEIRADYLDDTEAEDIATSSRQDFIQNDKRFIKLKEFVFQELKFIQKSRANYKAVKGTKEACEIPAVKEWFSILKGDSKKSAEKLFGRINSIATDEEHKKTLYKHGVLAFEHLHHKEKLQELEDLDINNFEKVVELFSTLDDIEATWYYEITSGRLEAIKTLIRHIDSNELETVIQRYIYEHLWLLDPSWDRATEPPRLEERVTTEFKKISNELNREEAHGRIDIRYKKITGKHVIIELKRAGRKITKGQLTDQVNKYRDALKKQLDAAGEDGAIECICLLGQLPNGWDDQETMQKGVNSLAAEDIRVVTYEQLIKDAQLMYQSYLEKSQDKGRIGTLLEAIDNS